jgi:hypothetical protein
MLRRLTCREAVFRCPTWARTRGDGRELRHRHARRPAPELRSGTAISDGEQERTQAVIIRSRNGPVLELRPDHEDLPQAWWGCSPTCYVAAWISPAKPVDYPPSSFVVRTWLHDVHVAAIRARFDSRRLSFDDIQRQPVQVPGKRAGDFRGPDGLAAVAHRYPDRKLHIGARSGWLDVLLLPSPSGWIPTSSSTGSSTS